MAENENKNNKTKKSGGISGFLFAVGAVCIAALMMYTSWPDIKPLLPGSEHTAAPIPIKELKLEIIKQHILKQCRLVTYTYETDVRVTLSDSAKIPFTEKDMPGFKREIILTVPVALDMETDLENMDVDFDAKTNAVKIAIPCSRIFRVTPNISSIKEESEVAFFRSKMTAEEQKWLVVEAEDEARRRADENDMYAAANEHAREVITSIIKELGIKYVDISIK